MKRAISCLFAFLVFVVGAFGIYNSAQASEKKNSWFLITLMMSPMQGYTVSVVKDEAECWAQAVALFKWADKGGVSMGAACVEIIPGQKPEGLIKDKDGKPKQLKKEVDS